MHRTRLLALTLTLLSAMLTTGSAVAATLSGSVAAQSASGTTVPAAGASVAALDPATHAVAASTTSDAFGLYELTVDPGTYDVRVEPAPGSTYGATTVSGVAVEGAARLDVVLAPAGMVRLSGVVRDDGVPAAGAIVQWGGATTQTAPDGTYSLVAPPGGGALAARLPVFAGASVFHWRVSVADVALAANGVLDVDVPARTTVTVRVLDEADGPIAGTEVSLGTRTVATTIGGRDATLRTDGGAQIADADGATVFAVFPGSDAGQPGQVRPPAGSGYGTAEFAVPVAAGPVAVDVRPPRLVRLTGVVRDDGVPAADAIVQWGGVTTTTAADGSYAIEATPGSGPLNARLPVFAGARVFRWRIGVDDVAVTADRTLDLDVPARTTTTVRVLDEADAPIAGTEVSMPERRVATSVEGLDAVLRSDGEVRTTGADGTAVFQTFPGAGVNDQLGQVRPPVASGYGLADFVVPVAAGPVAVDVRPPRLVRLSGVVRDGGAPAAGAIVQWGGVTATTAADGSYAIVATPGTSGLSARLPVPGGTRPQLWRLSVDGVTVTADRVLDLDVPARTTMTVRVLDDASEPLAGVEVSGGSTRTTTTVDGHDATLSTDGATKATGADGTTSFPALANSTGEGEVRPPAGSGYAPVAFGVTVGAGPTTIAIRFAPADFVAPVVACDPAPSGWHVDEVSVACTASDAGAGLAAPGDATFSLSTAVGDGSEDAVAQTGSRAVCDLAGNCTTAGPIGPIAVDRAAPQIAFSQAANGANGWWDHGPATVHVTATDLNVGTLSCTVDGVARRPPITSGPTTRELDLAVGGEGRHEVTCSASDTLGHVAQAAEAALIDARAPGVPSLTPDRAPDYAGGGGWWADAVTVTLTPGPDPALADGSSGSGVDESTLAPPQTLATSGLHVVRTRVADVAGNLSGYARLTVRVDADPPTTALACPAAAVALGRSATARWSDDDGESGLLGRAGGRVVLDTSASGTFTVEHVAVDRVGHPATSSCTYAVV